MVGIYGLINGFEAVQYTPGGLVGCYGAGYHRYKKKVKI